MIEPSLVYPQFFMPQSFRHFGFSLILIPIVVPIVVALHLRPDPCPDHCQSKDLSADPVFVSSIEHRLLIPEAPSLVVGVRRE
jgi:hypothetical protein